jgi:peptidoglycan/LPS O-acetylase OafA/YrhL
MLHDDDSVPSGIGKLSRLRRPMTDHPRGKMPRAGAHIPALDGVRGIAILLVMFCHFAQYSGMDRIARVDRWFYKATYAGWTGVDLFFVLSGFLITGILLDAKGNNNFFRNFYARRFLRIFPLYYGFLALFILIFPRAWPAGNDVQSVVDGQGWFWTYLVNVQLAVGGWAAVPYNGHFWSLAVEEQFYLFWPAVVFLLSRRGLMVACVLLVVASLGVRAALLATDLPDTAGYVLTFARMDVLAMGALVAVAIREPRGLIALHWCVRPVGIVAAAAVLALFMLKGALHPEDPIVQTAGYSLLAISFGALVAAVVISRPESYFMRAFAIPPLRLLGRYSYGLYILHPLVLLVLSENGVSVRAIPTFMGSQLPGHLAFSTLALALSLALAAASWHFYESRFLKLKTHFPYRHPVAPVDLATKQEARHAAH